MSGGSIIERSCQILENAAGKLVCDGNIYMRGETDELESLTSNEMGHYFFNESLCCWSGYKVIEWME
jgi:hypothetical protein